MKGKAGWLIAAAALVLGIVLYGGLSGQKSDQALIQEALESAIVAGREGRPGSVLEHLSREFEINGMQIANTQEVARYIRDQKPDVDVLQPAPNVQGETATIVSPITLKTTGVLKYETTIPGVRIEFAKENATRWLIFPAKQWKLTKVTIPPESWSAWSAGL